MSASQKVTELSPDEQTFTFQLPDGEVVVCGKPRGVLKLKLREVLSPDMLKDVEMVNITTALLSVKTVGGKPVLLHSFSTMAALMDRFGDDATLDEFMEKYQALTNPALTEVIAEVMERASREKLKPEQINEAITEAVFKIEADKRKRLRD